MWCVREIWAYFVVSLLLVFSLILCLTKLLSPLQSVIVYYLPEIFIRRVLVLLYTCRAQPIWAIPIRVYTYCVVVVLAICNVCMHVPIRAYTYYAVVALVVCMYVCMYVLWKQLNQVQTKHIALSLHCGESSKRYPHGRVERKHHYFYSSMYVSKGVSK